jgi:peptide deformylase
MEVVVPDEFRYLYERSAERPVVKVPDPVLRKVAAELERPTKDTQKLVDRMLAAMQKAAGIGLAAPQLGVLERVIVVATAGMKPLPMINPVIVAAEGEQIGQEGCLSIPGLYGDVKRAQYVEVEAMDLKGRMYRYEMEDMAARVTQHEVDHLDGVLFIDKVDLATLHWSHPEHEVAKAE